MCLAGASSICGEAERAETLQPGEEKARGNLIHLIEGSEEEGARLFSLVPTDRTKGNGHIKTQEIPSEHNETIFTVRVVSTLNSLPRKLEEYP